jgi:hypothetical protein
MKQKFYQHTASEINRALARTAGNNTVLTLRIRDSPKTNFTFFGVFWI